MARFWKTTPDWLRPNDKKRNNPGQRGLIPNIRKNRSLPQVFSQGVTIRAVLLLEENGNRFSNKGVGTF
jgi:hypothetical protein